MDKELINKKLAEHRQKVSDLADIEIELVTMIADQAPGEVVDKFLEWQAAREQADKDYLDILNLLNGSV
jgi:hypothetical protein